MTTAHLLDRLSLGKIVQIRERLLRAQAAGKKVYRFESGDPNFSLAPTVLEALQKAAVDGKTHYIPNAGIPELRKAITHKLRTSNGLPAVIDDHVFVTNGAMHALFALFQCLLSPGDEVIVPEPEWTEAVENVKLALGVPVAVPMTASTGYQYDPHEIERRITARTRAIFINTPHNPTGSVLSLDTLQAILGIARAHKLYIVSDEAYEDVIYEPNVHHSIASLAPDYQDHILSVFSFSKSHAMSGLRVGYLVSSDPRVMDRMQKVLRCTINGVNSVAQWTALAALQGDPSHLHAMKREYALRREVMFEALQGIPGIRPFRPQGAFYVWAEVDADVPARLGCKDVDGISAYLAERGVGSAPGDAFGDGCHGAIRFAFSCATSMVEQGAPVLRQLLTRAG
jgi:aspartate aminotransferase